MPFALGVALFVVAAILIVAVARSEITSTPILLGTIVVAAGIMSVYAIANFRDSSHIPVREGSCRGYEFPQAQWTDARATTKRYDEQRKLAADVVRCDVVRGATGARVRAVLGPPDRRAGRSSDREWTYLLGSDGGDITPTLTIRFRSGRVAQVFAPRP